MEIRLGKYKEGEGLIAWRKCRSKVRRDGEEEKVFFVKV